MTANSKIDAHAKKFKAQLDQLGCPFTEDVEESWVTEIMFKPGEPRIRLLQWLFSRFDPKLNELLDPHIAPANTKMDSRIQRLLFVASNLGLCNTDDADLIKGVTTLPKQTAFMTQLLDLVYVLDISQDPQAKLMISPGIVSEGMDTNKQFLEDCDLVDELSSETHMEHLFSTQFKVLPPDIKKHLERTSDEEGFKIDTDKPPPLPEIEDLIHTAESLSREVKKQNEILEELKQMANHEAIDTQATSQLNKSLKLVLCELTQLVMGFSSCFETELGQQCNREAPQLGELGSVFKRVHGLLMQFTNLLHNLGNIRNDHHKLCSEMKAELAKLPSVSSKGVASPVLSSNIQECLDILEESRSRLESIFTNSETVASTVLMPVNLTVSTIKGNS